MSSDPLEDISLPGDSVIAGSIRKYIRQRIERYRDDLEDRENDRIEFTRGQIAALRQMASDLDPNQPVI